MITTSVIVCTRNRPDQLRAALASIAAVLPADAEVIVVDQSDDENVDATIEEAPRTTVVRTGRRGLSAGRNDGMTRASGELIVFTDDDCVVPAGWVDSWQLAFDLDPAAGIGFGPVEAPPFDPEAGHTPTFAAGAHPSVHDLGVFRRGVEAVGMGANMALRRSAWEAAGGFDEALGAGRELAGAEEIDIAYRILSHGTHLMHLSAPAVMHYGFRSTPDASRLCRGYAAGTGAMYAKHVRCGDLYAGRLMVRDTARMVAATARRLAHGERPLGAGALLSYCRGAVSSSRLPVDRVRRTFDLDFDTVRVPNELS